jgi:pimeloyl-ACP methyl ester carboxylesterase
MRTASWGLLLLLAAVLTPRPAAASWRPFALDRTNRKLHGQLIDHTRNHLADRRIWSEALQERRDLYVYLPPGYDPCKRYPLILWLHGFAQDEHSFLEQVVERIDAAMACGRIPPAIVAAPDGSINGSPCLLTAGSFFLNTKAGCFEDYLMRDVWGFLMSHYPIRPEREAHVLAGTSMGGGAAYNVAFKYRDRFAAVLGIFPPLNNRWLDCHGRYFGDFDPCCWGWRTEIRRREVVGRFAGGVVLIRLKHILDSLYGRGGATIEGMARENPIEMLDAYDVQPGQLAMYIAYGGKDQFNIDAQVESFLHRAHERGLCVEIGYEPRGRHDIRTAVKLLPGILDWLARVLPPCPAAP